MSPTISAASKAVIPRKKILAERNESFDLNFSNTHVPKSPIFDSKSKPSLTNSSIDSSDHSLSRLSDFDDDDNDQNTFVPDLSSRPYDPLTNYLSPRPKFLRYKPSRRREIFLRHETEMSEAEDEVSIDKNVSFDSKEAIDEEIHGKPSSPLAPPSSEEGSVKEEDEGTLVAKPSTSLAPSSEKSSVKEEDEETLIKPSTPLAPPSSLEEGFVKEEDEEIEESEEEFEEEEQERGWNLKGIMNTLLVSVALVFSIMFISSMDSPTPSPDLQAVWGHGNEYWKIQNYSASAGSLNIFEGENDGFLNQFAESEVDFSLLNHHVANDDLVGDDENHAILENSGQMGEKINPELEVGESEAIGDHEEIKEAVSDHGVVENIDQKEEVLELKVEENELLCDPEMEIEEEVFNHVVENEELVEKFKPLLDNPIMIDRVDYQNPVFEIENDFEKEVNVDEDLEEVYDNIGAQKEEVHEDLVDSVEKGHDIVSSKMTENEDSNSETINLETELNSISRVVEKKGIIGVATIFTILASLILGFYFKSKKFFSKGSSQVLKPCSQSITERKSNYPIEEQQKHIEKFDSYLTSSSSLIRSLDESFEEYYSQRRAPKVELLDEFEVSSSIKENRRIEKEEKRYWNKAQSVPTHSQQSFSEFSSMDSPSYGSFTTEKKIIMKEDGIDGEVRKLVITPVRRSSRIRNRAVTSP